MVSEKPNSSYSVNIKSFRKPKNEKLNRSASSDCRKTKLKKQSEQLNTSNSDRFLPTVASDINLIQDEFFGSANQDNTKQLFEKSEIKLLEKNTSMNINPEKSDKILSYSKNLPVSNESGTTNSVKFQTKISNNAPVQPHWLKKRFIPKVPERTLDTPDLRNDFYLNLLHWGGNNTIAVGLSNAAYLWNASSGEVIHLGENHPQSNLLDDSKYDISSIRFSGNEPSSCLAVARDNGSIQLWDVHADKCLRTLREHSSRVAALSWNRHILSAGSQSGKIVHFDVRISNCVISQMKDSHTQEICSLAWSPDGRHLASGGNDNIVNLWTAQQVLSGSSPTFVLVEHNAAVKALAWHPKEVNLLASGGGTADGNVVIWNVYNGSQVAKIETFAQVSGIVWSLHYNEILTSHGYPSNRITIWNYPSFNVTTHLTGHSQRILAISANPDGSTIASIGADETLRLWKCFEVPKHSIKASDNYLENPKSTAFTLIR